MQSCCGEAALLYCTWCWMKYSCSTHPRHELVLKNQDSVEPVFLMACNLEQMSTMHVVATKREPKLLTADQVGQRPWLQLSRLLQLQKGPYQPALPSNRTSCDVPALLVAGSEQR